MAELLPCPFCGVEAEVHPAYDIDTDEVDGYFVICRNKNCTAWPETDEYPTEAEAIAAWNTRFNGSEIAETCDYGLRRFFGGA